MSVLFRHNSLHLDYQPCFAAQGKCIWFLIPNFNISELKDDDVFKVKIFIKFLKIYSVALSQNLKGMTFLCQINSFKSFK